MRHLDVGPTLLELCGLAPLADAAGVSLLPCLAGEAPFPPLAFAEERAHGYGLAAVRSAGWKRIQAPGRIETFDLSRDPGELRPADGPAELEEALDEFPRLYPARALHEVELDDATEEQLRALGYVR